MLFLVVDAHNTYSILRVLYKYTSKNECYYGCTQSTIGGFYMVPCNATDTTKAYENTVPHWNTEPNVIEERERASQSSQHIITSPHKKKHQPTEFKCFVAIVYLTHAMRNTCSILTWRNLFVHTLAGSPVYYTLLAAWMLPSLLFFKNSFAGRNHIPSSRISFWPRSICTE